MIEQIEVIRAPRIGDSTRRLDRRRRIGVAMIVAGGVLLLAGLWLAVTALMARSQLNQVRAEVHTLRAEITASDWTAARATATELANHAQRAHQLTSGPRPPRPSVSCHGTPG